jgi:5-methylcytosine-specific restriction protein A
MSTNRLSPQRGWAKYDALPRGENGRLLCRRCTVEVPKGRITFCSEQCIHEWKLRTQPRYVRKCVFERDGGRCALCPAVLPTLHGAWEADHILPVVEGGGECGLEGYRTLCRPDHQRVTARLMTRLAEKRRAQRGVA